LLFKFNKNKQMSKEKAEQLGLSPALAEKNKRLIVDIKRLHILKYGDPENGQISARVKGRPSKGDINSAAAKAERLYQAHRTEFHDQALLDDADHDIRLDE
jgi:hypothetical protein